MKKALLFRFVFLCVGVGPLLSGCGARNSGGDTARPGGSEGKDGEDVHWAASQDGPASEVDLDGGFGGGKFFMIAPVADEDDLHVILMHEPSLDWAKPGHLKLNRRGLVIRDVDETRLPPALKGWKGKKLHVYGEGKRSCEVVVQGFAMLAEAVAHFGTVEDWQGRGGEQMPGDGEVADAIWELATSGAASRPRGVWLTARVDKDRKVCGEKAVWARDADLPRPDIWGKVSSSAVTSEAVKLFRDLPAWKKIQEEFKKYKQSGLWDEFEGAVPQVKVFRHPSKDLHVVVVRGSAGHGCGSFEGKLWAAWEVKGGGWTRITREETGRDFQVTDVFSSDGENRPFLVDSKNLVVPSAGAYKVSLVYEIPFYDCGC